MATSTLSIDSLTINNGIELFNYPVASILIWLNSTLPSSNFLFCNGDPYDPDEFPDLYAMIGNTYGGSNTNPLLPNLNGRIPMGGSVNSGIPSSTSNLDNVSISNSEKKTGGNTQLFPSQLVHTHEVYTVYEYVYDLSHTKNTDNDSDLTNYDNLNKYNYNHTAGTVTTDLSEHNPPHVKVNYIIYAGYDGRTNANNYI